MTETTPVPDQRTASDDEMLASPSRSDRECPVFTARVVQDGVATLEVSGEVDIAVAQEFVAAAVRCLEDPEATVLRIDLAGVTFLDSSGLGALVQARNHAQSVAKSVVIANVAPTVMKVFTITGLADVLSFDG